MANISPYLQIIKEATSGEQVRDALINCMNEINKDAAFIVKSKTISGTLSAKGHATYRAEAGEVWKDVTLNITADDGSEVPQTVSKHDWEVNNETENKEYTAKELFGENSEFGTITVNLDFTRGVESIGDNVVISTFDLEDDGTWHAEADGRYSAVRSITFNNVDVNAAKGGTIGPGGIRYYTINYYDTDSNNKRIGQPLHSEQVQANTALRWRPKDQSPYHVGQNFVGWNPDKAVADGDVLARYADPNIGSDSINDDWAIIASKKGIGYPIGSYKLINVNTRIPYAADKACFPDIDTIPTSSETHYNYSLTTCMVKVAEGEAGTNSSWMSTNTVISGDVYGASNYYYYGVPVHIYNYLNKQTVDIDEDTNKQNQYDKSLWMKWLNEVFIQYVLPSGVKNAILPCQKSFIKSLYPQNEYINAQTSYGIWLPSLKEVFISGYDDDDSHYGDMDMKWSSDKGIKKKSIYVDNASGLAYMEDWLHLTSGINRNDYIWKQTTKRQLFMSRDSGENYGSPNPCGILSTYDDNGTPSSLVEPPGFIKAKFMAINRFGFCL